MGSYAPSPHTSAPSTVMFTRLAHVPVAIKPLHIYMYCSLDHHSGRCVHVLIHDFNLDVHLLRIAAYRDIMRLPKFCPSTWTVIIIIKYVLATPLVPIKYVYLGMHTKVSAVRKHKARKKVSQARLHQFLATGPFFFKVCNTAKLGVGPRNMATVYLYAQ